MKNSKRRVKSTENVKKTSRKHSTLKYIDELFIVFERENFMLFLEREVCKNYKLKIYLEYKMIDLYIQWKTKLA